MYVCKLDLFRCSCELFLSGRRPKLDLTLCCSYILTRDSTDNGLVPVWFTCNQFPPSLSRKPPRKSKCGEEADDECDDESLESQRRKPSSQPAKKRRIAKDPTSSSKNESISTSEMLFSSSESDTDFVVSSDPDASDRESEYSDDF